MLKRIAAVAAIGLAAMQVLAGSTGGAVAAGRALGRQSHEAVSTSSCTVAAGSAIVQSTADAAVWTDGTYLYCDVDGDSTNDFAPDAPELSDISSALVYSNGNVVVGLEQADGSAGGNDRPANYSGLRVTVDTAGILIFEGDGSFFGNDGLNGYYGGTIVLTDTAFSGQGLVGTIYAAIEGSYKGGAGPDSFDASAVTAEVVAWGNAGNDVLKSGSGDDELHGDLGSDKLYAGAGYDYVYCGGIDDDAADQCWGGPGDDVVSIGQGHFIDADTTIYDIAAPGDGYDEVIVTGSNPYGLTYADSSVAVEFDGDAVYSDTGDDTFTVDVADVLMSFTGSSKGDLLYGFTNLNGGPGADVIVGTAGDDTIHGGGGADKIRGTDGDDVIYGDSGADTVRGGPGDDAVFGGGGDDVLYGLGGVDFLKGGKGADQAWGGAGVDTCSAEVRDSCEFRKG